MKRYRIAGINFDHFHMGDLLRQSAEHPNAEIVGICDEQPSRMIEAVRNFSLDSDRVFTDVERCLQRNPTVPYFALLLRDTVNGSKK
jgi:glucose-fructose oxidoreductase